MNDFTTDSLFDGALTIKQSRHGYRFTVDSVLLAHFIRPAPHETVADLGTGSGIMPLILAHRYPDLSVTGVEIQTGLADLSRANFQTNNLARRLTLIHADLNNLSADDFPARPGCVISNPPYIPQGSGRLNPMMEKAVARHEITVTLSGLVSKASELLPPGGRFALIYPFDRRDELIARLSAHGFAPTRIRRVHSLKDGPPRRVLVDAVKGAYRSPKIEEPLFIFIRHGVHSADVAKMYSASY